MKKFAFIFIFILLMQDSARSQENEFIRQDLWKNPPRVNYDDNLLPSSYDLRIENRVSPVRNQSPWGTCWTFAAIASMESTYRTLHNKSESLGIDLNLNLSEMFPSWFVYKSPGKGKSFGLPNPKKDIMHQSGTSYQITALFSRLGTVSEDVLPYPSNKSSYENGKYKPDKLPEDYEKSNIYLKEVYQIGTIKNNAVINLVKNLIIQKGAVYAHYYSQSSSYLHNKGSKSTSYFNNSKSRTKTNHAVIIIGWDDNYSRENFAKSMRPSKNGAWLIQNSRGESWGDKGCFWMSYEQYIESAALFIADKESTRLKHYGYDDLGCTGCLGSASSKGVSYLAANVFRSGGRETLKEIAFYTMDNNAFYEAYIYKLGKGKNRPSSPVNNNNSCAVSIPESFIPFAGYHTVKLSKDVNLDEGEYFSVVIKMRTPYYEYPVAMEIQTPVNKSVLVNQGESYFAIANSKWYDGAKDFQTPRNACIKAFTVESSQ